MYEEYYKFRGRPFQLTPDLKFLYPSPGHKRALSYLHYGLEQAEGFVIITGNIGTGKTLLITTLLAELQDQEIATARIAAANVTEDNVLEMAASALKLPYEGKSKAALLRDLELSLRRAQDYLNGVLLIVDEAQELTVGALEELRILSNLESNGRALMQIFLVGQSELRATLRQPNMEHLRQRTIASYQLEPLSVDETKRYIGFRLVAVGWDGEPNFDPDFYGAIHRHTGGVPRKINILMDRVLVYGYLEELREFGAEDVEDVVEELSKEIAGDLGDSTAQASVPSNGSVTGTVTISNTSSSGASRADLEARLARLEAQLQKLVGDAS
ncbi:MAG: AAA family ATPase [Pseudomonadota bacterium]